MPLLRYTLRINRAFVQTFTGSFYVLGCVLVAFYSISALAPEPIQFKPEIPSWGAQALLWFSVISIWAFAVYLAEQVVAHVTEKVKGRSEKNAPH